MVLSNFKCSKIKQDIYDKWTIIIPLSTYYVPYLKHNVNVTQSVGYISLNTEDDAKKYMEKLINPCFKVIIHLTRYGNFVVNNWRTASTTNIKILQSMVATRLEFKQKFKNIGSLLWKW